MSSSSSSSTLTSQVVVFATAMAAFSGTVILFAIKTQKSLHSLSSSKLPILRPCLSSGEKKKKNKKSVRFAEDVIEPSGDNEEFRKNRYGIQSESRKSNNQNRGMPANRVALYNGILRDRVIHNRFACTF